MTKYFVSEGHSVSVHQGAKDMPLLTGEILPEDLARIPDDRLAQLLESGVIYRKEVAE